MTSLESLFMNYWPACLAVLAMWVVLNVLVADYFGLLGRSKKKLPKGYAAGTLHKKDYLDLFVVKEESAKGVRKTLSDAAEALDRR